MTKNNFLCIDLKTVMLKDALPQKGKCYTGVLSRIDEEHYRFEESIRRTRAARNPKLYDGDYISMTRRTNGKYQLYLKAMEPTTIDPTKYAFDVYGEIIAALKIMN